MNNSGGAQEETERRRVYLGGLAPSVSAQDLQSRLQSFGAVSDISLPLASDGLNKGFAHFSVTTTGAQWRKLASAYNGSLWRGSKLRIEAAQPASRAAQPASTEPAATKRVRKLVRHRGDMSLMSDALAGKRSGWKKGRYGRAVPVVRTRRPDGRMITVDPAHHKDRYEKLFGSVRPLPISKLTWSIVDGDGGDGGDDDSDGSDDDSSDGMEDDGGRDADSGLDSNDVDSGSGNDDGFDSNPDNDGGVDSDFDHDHDHDDDGGSTSSGDALSPDGTKSASAQEPPAPGGFSLGRLLGLAAEPIQEAPAPRPVAHVEVGPVARRREVAPLAELLFDMARFPTDLAEYAFCRRSGAEEALLLWKASRSDLRKDFRSRMKQARQRAKTNKLRQ